MVAEWVEHSAYNRDSKSVIVPLRALLFQNEFSITPYLACIGFVQGELHSGRIIPSLGNTETWSVFFLMGVQGEMARRQKKGKEWLLSISH